MIFFAGIISGFVFAPVFFVPGILGFSYLCYQTKISTNAKSSLAKGYIFGFGHFLSGIYWISIGVSVYIQEFWWAIPLALFGLPAILASFIALSSCASWHAPSKYYYLIFSIAWVCFEWVRSWIFTGFPWNLAGYALSFSTTLIQAASIFGIYGLSFIVIYLASSFYFIFIDRKSVELKISFINFIIIIASLVCYGTLRLKYNPTSFSDISVKLVQPSIPQAAKWDPNEFLFNLDRLIDLSKSGSKTDLIIWSEAALTAPYEYPLVKMKINEMLKDTNSILISGAITYTNRKNKFKLYSAMQGISPQKEELFEYHKNHLVPFGEYIPFKEILPIRKLTPGLIDYSKGSNQLVYLRKFNLWIRPLICYESIFPALARTINKFSDVIINITNDSWYGRSSGPYQHLYISVMRAVENGLPMIRVANNGVSAVVDPAGRIIDTINLNEIKSLDTKIPEKLKFPTTYSIFGDITLVILIIGIAILHLLLTLLTKRLFYYNKILD